MWTHQCTHCSTQYRASSESTFFIAVIQVGWIQLMSHASCLGNETWKKLDHWKWRKKNVFFFLFCFCFSTLYAKTYALCISNSIFNLMLNAQLRLLLSKTKNIIFISPSSESTRSFSWAKETIFFFNDSFIGAQNKSVEDFQAEWGIITGIVHWYTHKYISYNIKKKKNKDWMKTIVIICDRDF